MKSDSTGARPGQANGGRPVYRHYDRAALDAEYDNQAKVGKDGFRAFLARCEAQNAEALRRWQARIDVPYGATPAEKLDLFVPRSPTPAPVEVFFHGGYWRMLDKKNFSYVANGFLPHGRLTVVVNYGLVPAVTFDTLVEQCRRALAWVWRHIGEFGGDPRRVAVSGHSAGGHVVAMLLAARWADYGVEEAQASLEAASALSGLYDLEPIRQSFLNDILGLDAEVARCNSPTLLAPRVRTPLLVAVGGREGEEYLHQSRSFVDAWLARGADATLEVFEADDHFTLREQLGDPQSAVVRRLMRQRRHGGAVCDAI